MGKIPLLFCLILFIGLSSCNENLSSSEIMLKTIDSIDTIETIYYKQDMLRSNPRNIKDTIFRYREIYLKRLITDSIVGVKGHWYMYVDDKENVIYEDVYDGNRLVRKNNRDSLVRIYDLVKFPEFKRRHFWSHNTLYGMQYEFRYILDNRDSYTTARLNDTIIQGNECYQLMVRLEHKTTMPGFATKLENDEGAVFNTLYCIDKKTNYPIRMKGERYSTENPGQKTLIDQRVYDVKFNLTIDEKEQFNTSEESLTGYQIREMHPE